MAFYVPVIQTPYLVEGLFSEEKFARLMSAGVMDFSTLAQAFPGKTVGDLVNLPNYVQVPDAQHVDLAATDPVNSGLTFTGVSTNDSVSPILRDVIPYSWTEHDRIRTGEDFERLASITAGNKIAKRTLQQTFRVLDAAIYATTQATTHNFDQTAAYATTSGCLTVASIRKAKALCGDQGVNLKTMLCHSAPFADLLNDLIVNYKYNAASIQAILTGELDAVMGVSNIIVSDDITAVANAVSGAPDVYSNFLLGPGALFYAYVENPRVESWSDIRTPNTNNIEKVTFDYAIGPRGVKYTSTANPTDGRLGSGAYWTVTSEDHRNVRVARIQSYGGIA